LIVTRTIPRALLQETKTNRPIIETNEDLTKDIEELEAALKRCNLDKALTIERLEGSNKKEDG